MFHVDNPMIVLDWAFRRSLSLFEPPELCHLWDGLPGHGQSYCGKGRVKERGCEMRRKVGRESS